MPALTLRRPSTSPTFPPHCHSSLTPVFPLLLQDDVLYESLTVWETLLYAALLRLPRTMTMEAKHARVQEVLESLGLAKSRNTIIGG